MKKKVLLSTKAQSDYRRLPSEARKRIKGSLERLAAANKRMDIKKLKGIRGREDLFRLRVGHYRVIYQPERDAIKVIRIELRGTDYGWLD